MHHSETWKKAWRTVGAVIAVSAVALLSVGASRASADVQPAAECTITLRNDAYSTPQDTPLVVPDIGVVTNDDICNTDGLVISVTAPTHGTLSDFDDSGGGFTYTPSAGFTGVDSFTYTLEDVHDIPAATVTITVDAAATTTTTLATTTTEAPTTTIAAVKSAQLARTGRHLDTMFDASVALILVGVTLTGAARRRGMHSQSS